MKKCPDILKLNKNNAQSIVEYSFLFATIAVVMIFAINGPIRNSLQGTFQGLIYIIGNSVSGLMP